MSELKIKFSHFFREKNGGLGHSGVMLMLWGNGNFQEKDARCGMNDCKDGLDSISPQNQGSRYQYIYICKYIQLVYSGGEYTPTT